MCIALALGQVSTVTGSSPSAWDWKRKNPCFQLSCHQLISKCSRAQAMHVCPHPSRSVCSPYMFSLLPSSAMATAEAKTSPPASLPELNSMPLHVSNPLSARALAALCLRRGHPICIYTLLSGSPSFPCLLLPVLGMVLAVSSMKILEVLVKS